MLWSLLVWANLNVVPIPIPEDGWLFHAGIYLVFDVLPVQSGEQGSERWYRVVVEHAWGCCGIT